jgi:dihydrofolate reductase
VRKLVVAEYVSLDGVIQAPGHAGEDDAGGFTQGGWTGPYMADHRRYNSEFYQTAGGFLLGRLTYEIFAASWPKVTDEHDQIARALNTLPKYVASRSLPQADWQGTTVLDGDVPAAVADLKRQPGGPWWSSAAASWPGRCGRPTWSTSTGCGCTRSCWAAASGCSATAAPRPASGSPTARRPAAASCS